MSERIRFLIYAVEVEMVKHGTGTEEDDLDGVMARLEDDVDELMAANDLDLQLQDIMRDMRDKGIL